MEKINLLYAGYEWYCPDCGQLNRYAAANAKTLTCANCKKKFKVIP